MKRIYLSLCFLSVFIFIIQNQSFTQIDYTQYLYPDVDFHSLNMQFLLNGDNSSTNFSHLIGQERQNNNFFQVRGDLQYYRLVNTRPKQRVFYSFLSGNYSKRNNSGDLNDQKASLSNLFLWHFATERKYSTENNFTEFTYGINSSYNRSNINENIGSLLFASPEVGLRIGSGRIEPARELFDAMFIIDDLREKGYLLNEESQNEIFELAQLMAVARQTRLLDFRVQRIHQLEVIANWLTERVDNITERDYNHITTIVADNWNYNLFNDRALGSRKSIGADVRFSYNKFYKESASTALTLVLYGEFYNTKALTRFLHRSTGVFPGINYRRTLSGNISEGYFPFLNSIVRYDYYPNSRTRLSASGGGDISYLPKSYSGRESSSFNFLPSIQLDAEYFINYQFRILATITSSYAYSTQGSFRHFSNVRHEIYNSFTSLLPLFSDSNLDGPVFFDYNDRFLLNYNISLLYSFF